ncbi:hypothetical protein KIPB_005312 [Kipferlia bialata]|uniref:Uncharacterized protein n=1 Tax=Kipferlia bialata TaxID=797122 RepID=A0A9K3GIF9_9EUKA|nr:hypothetical protein KIPB_005312 [Kipferlia bialata]|eukprot:g5312.t1
MAPRHSEESDEEVSFVQSSLDCFIRPDPYTLRRYAGTDGSEGSFSDSDSERERERERDHSRDARLPPLPSDIETDRSQRSYSEVSVEMPQAQRPPPPEEEFMVIGDESEWALPHPIPTREEPALAALDDEALAKRTGFGYRRRPIILLDPNRLVEIHVREAVFLCRRDPDSALEEEERAELHPVLTELTGYVSYVAAGGYLIAIAKAFKGVLYMLDLGSLEWRVVSAGGQERERECPSDRGHPQCVALNDQLLLFGGWPEIPSSQSDSDLDSGSDSQHPTYCLGYSDIWAFDPDSLVWQRYPDMPPACVSYGNAQYGGSDGTVPFGDHVSAIISGAVPKFVEFSFRHGWVSRPPHEITRYLKCANAVRRCGRLLLTFGDFNEVYALDTISGEFSSRGLFNTVSGGSGIDDGCGNMIAGPHTGTVMWPPGWMYPDTSLEWALCREQHLGGYFYDAANGDVYAQECLREATDNGGMI